MVDSSHHASFFCFSFFFLFFFFFLLNLLNLESHIEIIKSFEVCYIFKSNVGGDRSDGISRIEHGRRDIEQGRFRKQKRAVIE